jgi:hypothetical protein
MYPVRTLRLVAAVALLFACGCSSNNKGKIEATRWTSLPGVVKGISLPADALQLSFGGDGRMIYRIRAGSVNDTYNGTYSLGFGDMITFELDRELAGIKNHTETAVITGDRMVLTDSDGTSLTFVKK